MWLRYDNVYNVFLREINESMYTNFWAIINALFFGL